MGVKRRQTTEVAVQVVRLALTEVLGARDGEQFNDALNRLIDRRIAGNRWYRRLWRAVKL